MEKKIDAFHRRQLRYALGIHYPKKISNENLYKLTKVVPWSQTIQQRRLYLLGHICRAPEETPAHQAFIEALKQTKRKCGGQKLTWLALVKKDLDKIGIKADDNMQNIIKIASDRDVWKSRTKLMKIDVHNGGQPSEDQ